MYARNQDRDTATNWATRQAQYDAVCNWGVPDHAALQRISAIKHPAFVANGDSDPMILPHYSYLLAGLIPQAKVKIYPDAAHGFLFQRRSVRVCTSDRCGLFRRRNRRPADAACLRGAVRFCRVLPRAALRSRPGQSPVWTCQVSSCPAR